MLSYKVVDTAIKNDNRINDKSINNKNTALCQNSFF